MGANGSVPIPADDLLELRSDQGPKRNGNRKVEELIHQSAKDMFVGWAWARGYGRQSASRYGAQAGVLVEAWVKTGAACPN